jgi:hypothetical protein
MRREIVSLSEDRRGEMALEFKQQRHSTAS